MTSIQIFNFSAHSAALNPTSIISSSTSSGRFTSVPLIASSFSCSFSLIPGSLSFSHFRAFWPVDHLGQYVNKSYGMNIYSISTCLQCVKIPSALKNLPQAFKLWKRFFNRLHHNQFSGIILFIFHLHYRQEHKYCCYQYNSNPYILHSQH